MAKRSEDGVEQGQLRRLHSPGHRQAPQGDNRGSQGEPPGTRAIRVNEPMVKDVGSKAGICFEARGERPISGENRRKSHGVYHFVDPNNMGGVGVGHESLDKNSMETSNLSA